MEAAQFALCFQPGLMVDSGVFHTLPRTEALDMQRLFPQMPHGPCPPCKACINTLLRYT